MYVLSFNRSINRASACASATVNALISVDYINSISLRDSLSRAFTCAYAAADARIFNYISHCKQPPLHLSSRYIQIITEGYVEFKMKVYALVGKSGTGKSYQAQNLCKELNIDGIIDDGLFIYENKVMAGISAKRQSTKVGAVKTALFTKEEHQKDVASAIRKIKPRKILVIGTSDEMVKRIADRLELPEIYKTIYITDITTESERAIAYKQRHEMGKHVIPAPAFQLKRQFSGYFMSPLLIFKEWSANKGAMAEKSVVRPTYSYMGDYNLSDKVFSDIVECAAESLEGIEDVIRVLMMTTADGGVEITALVGMRYGYNMVEQAKLLQEQAGNQIEAMTACNVNRFNVEIRSLR